MAEVRYVLVELNPWLKGLHARYRVNPELEIMSKFRVKKGYVISSREESEERVDGKKVTVVPAHKFLVKIPQSRRT